MMAWTLRCLTLVVVVACMTSHTEAKCDLDLVFVVDSSGSITQNAEDSEEEDEKNNWELIKQFLIRFINATEDLTAGGEGTRVALVKYSTEVLVEFYLDTYTGNRAAMLQAVHDMEYAGHWTNTAEALRVTKDDILGKEGDRSEAQNVVIILTDGMPEITKERNQVAETLQEAANLREEGAYIFAVGVTTGHSSNPVSRETLRLMSSPPQQENLTFWHTPDFQSLFGILLDLSTQVCDVPVPGSSDDVILILDDSGSIGRSGFADIQEAAARIIENVLDVGDKDRVGCVSFSNDDAVKFQLNTYDEMREAAHAVRAIQYRGGRTNLEAAFEYVQNVMFKPENGDRPWARNIVIVMTDARHNMPDDVAMYDDLARLKAAGIHSIAIGYGVVDQYELRIIASYPWQRNAIIAESVSELNSVSSLVGPLLDDDDCTSGPCDNGGTCKDAIGHYICHCTNGYGGSDCTYSCRKPADVVFAIDASGSVGIRSYMEQIDFVAGIMSRLNIINHTRVGVLDYSDTSRVLLHLDGYTTSEEAYNKLWSSYRAGSTDTASAMFTMRTQMFTDVHGSTSARDKVGVLFSDGKSSDLTATWRESMLLHRHGVEMMSIGIGGKVRDSEMEQIASGTTLANVLTVEKFEELEDISDEVEDFICDNEDECDGSICENAGQCMEGRNSYHCDCADGHTGLHCERNCDGVLDLVIILDRSSGMRRGRYLNVVLFVSSILEQMEISGDKTRVGVISYADLAQIEFDLDQYTTKQEVMQHLERLDSTGGKANAAHALELMTDDLLSSAHGNREDVPDVCLFMTHAKSSVDKRDTLSQAWSARNRGVHIVVVGLGTDADMMEIDGIASDPKSLNAFHAPSWRDLPSRFDDVLKATCDSVDECSDAPCASGATCRDMTNSYFCECAASQADKNCNTRCSSDKMDVVFLVDVTRSADITHDVITPFVRLAVEGLPTKHEQVRIAIVSYAQDIYVHNYLDGYQTTYEIMNTVNFRKLSGGGRVDDALRKIRTDVFSGPNGDRAGIDNKLILLTEGRNSLDSVVEARELKAADVDIYSVAVGDSPNYGLLNELASNPSSDYVITVDGESMVTSAVEDLLEHLCD